MRLYDSEYGLQNPEAPRLETNASPRQMEGAFALTSERYENMNSLNPDDQPHLHCRRIDRFGLRPCSRRIRVVLDLSGHGAEEFANDLTTAWAGRRCVEERGLLKKLWKLEDYG